MTLKGVLEDLGRRLLQGLRFAVLGVGLVLEDLGRRLLQGLRFAVLGLGFMV